MWSWRFDCHVCYGQVQSWTSGISPAVCAAPVLVCPFQALLPHLSVLNIGRIVQGALLTLISDKASVCFWSVSKGQWALKVQERGRFRIVGHCAGDLQEIRFNPSKPGEGQAQDSLCRGSVCLEAYLSQAC